MFFAILLPDCIGTTLSAAIKKEGDDLRQVRNDIAHISEAKLSDAEFGVMSEECCWRSTL